MRIGSSAVFRETARSSHLRLGPDGLRHHLQGWSATAAPVFDQSVRTLGWAGANSVRRQDNTLYVTSGYWGVQPVALK